jgi:hypothetical protein
VRYCLSDLFGVTAVVCRGLAALLCPKVIAHWLGPQFLLVAVRSVLMLRCLKCVIMHF